MNVSTRAFNCRISHPAHILFFIVNVSIVFLITHIDFEGERTSAGYLSDDHVFGIDKFLHVLFYIATSFTALLASQYIVLRVHTKVTADSFIIWMGATLAIVCALADELTQPMFGRTATLFDLLADVVGIAIGVAFWLTFVPAACERTEK